MRRLSKVGDRDSYPVRHGVEMRGGSAVSVDAWLTLTVIAVMVVVMLRGLAPPPCRSSDGRSC